MKALAVSVLFAAGLGATGAWAQSAASAPVYKPAMRPISAATTPSMAVPGPARADEVWVNTSSRVYHCPGNRWYGRTPKGRYMNEADAKAQGYRSEVATGCR